MSENIWDTAIVGGGPAGCSAAISLARQGMNVILFEAKTYPHDKLCGEFLSPECTGIFQELGFSSRLRELGAVPVHSASLTAPDGSAWETCLPGTALSLSRKVLDQAMAEEVQRVGGIVQEASTVTSLSGSLEEGFELQVTGLAHRENMHARTVIAAHGKRSKLDRALDRRFLKQRQPFVALKAHFHGPPIPGRIELHAFPGGYCGMSEIEDGKKVVCLLAQESVFQAAHGTDGFVEWMQSQNLFLRSWLQWADRIHEKWISIAQVPFVTKPVLEQDVLMAGDAAGLIAPLAGNGIAMALEEGMLAANYTGQFLLGEMNAADVRKSYPWTWQKRYGLRLRLGRVLQSIYLHPVRAAWMLRLMEKLPRLGEFLVRQTRGKP